MCFHLLLEGTARYAGLLLAPAEGYYIIEERQRFERKPKDEGFTIPKYLSKSCSPSLVFSCMFIQKLNYATQPDKI